MILKYISIPELDFTKSWEIGLKKIRSLNNFDKYMTLFWLIGPFIYLIERDPADLWLTIIGFIFIYRCFVKKDWTWTNKLWFKSAFLFWIVCLLTSIIGIDPFFSFQQSFVWIRFPIYALAAQVWLGKDRDIRILMLLSLLGGMILMCFILVAEVLISPSNRLSWPYGDLVPGGYLAKVCLPIFIILIIIGVNQPNKKGFFAILVSCFTMVMSVLTGERTNLLIKLCSSFFASIVFKPNFKILLILLIVQLFSVFTVITLNPDFKSRFTESFVQSVNIFSKEYNTYWGAWRGGIQQAIETPVTGIGPSGTRKTCKDLNPNNIPWLPGKNYCGNHPHNFYIQLFAETGFLGFLLGSFMMISIFITCYGSKKLLPDCPIAASSFIIPLALFFPLQQFGSFFGQWGNLFIWFAIGFALSNNQK